ncbi:glycosyltransferase [Agriterribacter sp.]|uniref:glycosyltransferase family protein n=1 Tax=Agriterribacter sp. TaxID=2821509 RepID=UPI002C65D6AB|nr:glycosyltransferase [Agriterribacter sp.]HRP57955.1 glycosyltransferase [Agriterribacter sp.]
MTIAFIHNNRAFLPEIEAYVSFFSAHPGILTRVSRQSSLHNTPADVEWYFMGTQVRRSKNAVVVHEYASASVPPLATLRNIIKRNINCLPDYRIFYSEYVRRQFDFRDNIPFGLRGHGIMNSDPASERTGKRYDFIYVGSIDKKREPDVLLNCFAGGNLKDRTLLVLSRDYTQTALRLSGHKNIFFKGPVPYHQVYSYIHQSRYAINFMPDISPFNRQVSAKFLDYAACGIPVVTSDYQWIKEFESVYGGRYYYLLPDLSNLTWEQVNAFSYAVPDLREWTWKTQIEKSGITGFLQKRFPGLDFAGDANKNG